MEPVKKTFSFGPRIQIPEDHVFLETERVIAFVNLRPFVPGHILICPKTAGQYLKDTEDLQNIMIAAQPIGRMLCDLHKTEQIHYTIQDGPNAGQTVPHLHMHVMPGKSQEIGHAENFGAARTFEDMRLEAVLYRNLLIDKYLN